MVNHTAVAAELADSNGDNHSGGGGHGGHGASNADSVGAMTMRPRFMRPCKSSSLDYRSLLNTSQVVKNENGFCVPVLIGPYKWGLNEHRQLVPMVNTLKYVER
jgi:hypothetical protein